MGKIKRAKSISIVLLFIMVFQLMMPVNFAYAAEDEGEDITEHVIWNEFVIKFLNDKNEVIDSIDISSATSGTAITGIPRDAIIRIDANFALPDDDPENPDIVYNFMEGDYFVLKFPEAMKFEDGEFDITNDGIDLKLIISGTTATFVITRIEESDISGDIWMNGSIDEDKIKDDTGANVDLVFMGKIIRIGFEDYEAPEIVVTLEKSGEFVYGIELSDGNKADGILWTIRVTTDTPTDGVRIEDDFGNDQEFIEGSFKVDGAFVTGYNIDGTVLKYEFDGEISGEKIITYLTKPNLGAFDGKETGNKDQKTVKFVNDAKVYLNDVKKDEDSDEVELDSIKKEGNALDIGIPGRRIEWKIKVNNYNLNGQKPYIEDMINPNLTLVQGNDKYPISISYDGGTDIPLSSGSDGYTYSSNILSYKLRDGFKTAVLTYYTDIETPNDNANDNDLSFSNEAYLKWDGDDVIGSSDGVSVGIGGGMISKSSNFTGLYVKGEGNNEIIRWTVVINRNRLNIGAGAKFVDIIPEGLEFIQESFKVDNTDAAATVTGSSITYIFGENFNNMRTITYDTRVKDSHIPIFVNGGDTGTTYFTNKASFFALGKEHKDEYIQGVKSNVIKKTNVSYDYDTGILTWRIVVNESKITLNNAVLTDVIGNGMEFISGSFTVNGEVVPDPISGKTISYHFPQGANDKFVITFQVKVDKEYLKANNVNGKVTLDNKAILEDNGNRAESSAKVIIDNKVIEKNMEVSGDKDYIEWEVPINASKLTLSNIEIWDELQKELELDVNTVRLFEATVDPDTGELSKKGNDSIELKDLEEWDDSSGSLEFYKGYDAKRLTIKVKGTISKPYILEFTTDVVVANSFDLSNKIEFRGTGVSANDTEGQKNFIVSDAGGNVGSGSGKLTVLKLDVDNKELIVDSEATFEIYRMFVGNKILVKSDQEEFSTTDGKVILEKLLYKKHFIKEVKAPEGYLRDDTVHEVWITKDMPQVTYPFVNKKAEADIVFTKQNNFRKSLSGVEFTLYKEDKTTVEAGPVLSGSDGKVKFLNIAPGTYYIKETGTPTGYKPLTDSIKVTVSIINDGTEMGVKFNDENINEPYVVTNDLIDGVMVIKLDSSGDFLGDAVFGIYGKYSDAKIKEATSDKNGIVLFEDIEAGEYYIKEISSPAGYIKSTDVVYVNVEEDKEDSKKLIVSYKKGDQPYSADRIEFTNDPINIEFIKQDNNGGRLAGAEFTLYEEDGTTIFEGRNPIRSDAEGKVVFTAIPVGEYVIKETNAPSGYRELGKDIIVEVAINDDGKPRITFTYSDESEVKVDEDGKLVVINERKPTGGGGGITPVYGKVVVKKVDEDKKVLSGAEFTLYDAKSKVVGKAITGPDGTVSFEELEPGEYVLKETKAPKGYVFEENETDVTISANKTNTYTVTNKKEEPKKPGRIEIIKTDENGKLLSEAWFSLIDGNGTTLQNVVTVNGRAEFKDVPAGKYTVKEVQAPEGYELTEQQVNVTVESEKTMTVKFVNKKSGTTIVPVSGKIIINKVDENNMALAGAEFTLYNENNEIIETAVSDESGRVIFENLKDGKYFVKETEAPEGYRLVSDSLTVNVTGGSSSSYRFKNVPDTEEIEDPDIPMGWEEIDDPEIPTDVVKLPDTGSLLNTWMLAVIGMLLILTGILLYGRKTIKN